jgi:glutamine synthetase
MALTWHTSGIDFANICSHTDPNWQAEEQFVTQVPSPFTFVATPDFAGLLRGKGVPAAAFERRCAGGIGWAPTNIQITCFDTIADSPFGAMGDVVLRGDPATRITAPLPDGEVLDFALGDITDLCGAPWECCGRSMLRTAAARLLAETGLEVRASFEHEFMFLAPDSSAAFSLAGFARQFRFARALAAALDGTGIEPDSFLREYGPGQMEVTIPPAPALQAADQAACLREITRAVGRAMGQPLTFSPLVSPDLVGNGVHVHISLWDSAGHPATHDPTGQHGLSKVAGAFIAGILANAGALTAITAPSAISALRLTPHRWSAAYNNLGVQDREAAVRICPVLATEPDARARQFNFEYRAADAAASPHLALAALIETGMAGMRANLPVPVTTTGDISQLPPEALKAQGLLRLPESLGAALAALDANATLRAAFPGRAIDIYIAHKRAEASHVAAMDADARFSAYAAIY